MVGYLYVRNEAAGMGVFEDPASDSFLSAIMAFHPPIETYNHPGNIPSVLPMAHSSATSCYIRKADLPGVVSSGKKAEVTGARSR